MDRYHQIDRHSFIIKVFGVPRDLILTGCQQLAEEEARTICEEDGFEYVKYSGVVR